MSSFAGLGKHCGVVYVAKQFVWEVSGYRIRQKKPDNVGMQYPDVCVCRWVRGSCRLPLPRSCRAVGKFTYWYS